MCETFLDFDSESETDFFTIGKNISNVIIDHSFSLLLFSQKQGTTQINVI